MAQQTLLTLALVVLLGSLVQVSSAAKSEIFVSEIILFRRILRYSSQSVALSLKK